MNKWIKFVEKDKKPKTKVFSIMSKTDNSEIGEIKWYPAWRQYCLCTIPEIQTIYSTGCLQAISEFITKLNEKHKKAKERIKK